MNNLLERLHASFFFFLLVRPTTFMKIGSYLPSAILIGVALLFSGLREWVNAGWVLIADEAPAKSEKSGEPVPRGKWARRRRPVIRAIAIMAATHALGAIVFYLLSSAWYLNDATVRIRYLHQGTLPTDAPRFCSSPPYLPSASLLSFPSPPCYFHRKRQITERPLLSYSNHSISASHRQSYPFSPCSTSPSPR